jgi:hypothetical protein
MASIGAMRDGIQTRLQGIEGLYAYDTEKGTERMPCAIVFPSPPGGGYFEVANAARSYAFVVELHVALTGDIRKAQDRLDGYINPTGTASVQAAILGDTTLAGAANTTSVQAFTAYGFSTLNSVPTLMARIPVEVTV